MRLATTRTSSTASSTLSQFLLPCCCLGLKEYSDIACRLLLCCVVAIDSAGWAPPSQRRRRRQREPRRLTPRPTLAGPTDRARARLLRWRPLRRRDCAHRGANPGMPCVLASCQFACARRLSCANHDGCLFVCSGAVSGGTTPLRRESHDRTSPTGSSTRRSPSHSRQRVSKAMLSPSLLWALPRSAVCTFCVADVRPCCL